MSFTFFRETINFFFAMPDQRDWLIATKSARRLGAQFLLMIRDMAFPVVEFSREGYKIRKVFG